MNNPRFHRILVGLCAALALLVGVAANAQGQNLLTNPGFENPYVNQGGSPTRMVAQGWTAWHIPADASAPSYQNQQPEYSQTAPDTTRIHSGSNAQLLSSFFATHTGGVYQKVSGITLGAKLTFSTYAYVWSSAFDDPSVSEQDGGVIIQVGIDPTGGTDATSSNVVWSAAASKYDAYIQVSVSTTAKATSVTVYIRSTISAPAKNNNIYLDDASLAVSGGAPTATKVEDGGIVNATSTPTATATTGSIEASPTQEEPTITLTPSPTAPTATPTASPTVDMTVYKSTITYTVVRGDTLQAIASLYGSSVDAIVSINSLADSDVIAIGQQLLIPVRVPPLASATPTDTPNAPPTNIPTQVPVISTTSYVVQFGDTLSRIAARFGVTTQALAQLNGIVNPDLVYFGQTLLIPTSSGGTVIQPTPIPGITPVPAPAQTYTVQPGDNLYQISLRTGVSLLTLINLNGITDPNRIFVGQTLRLA